MATVNPSIVSAFNDGAQLFYTTQQVTTIPAVSGDEDKFPAVLGADYYVSAGTAVPLTFTNTETTVGTDITFDGDTGNIEVTEDITYQFTVTSDVATTGGAQTGLYQLYDATAEALVGQQVPFGTALVVTVTPGVATTYQVVAVTADGTEWLAPGQIANAAITITAASGFEQ